MTNRERPAIRRALMALVAVALVATACGDDDGNASGNGDVGVWVDQAEFDETVGEFQARIEAHGNVLVDHEGRIGDLESGLAAEAARNDAQDDAIAQNAAEIEALRGEVDLLKSLYEDFGCGCTANDDLMVRFEVAARAAIGTPYEGQMTTLLIALDECGRAVVTGTTTPAVQVTSHSHSGGNSSSGSSSGGNTTVNNNTTVIVVVDDGGGGNGGGGDDDGFVWNDVDVCGSDTAPGPNCDH